MVVYSTVNPPPGEMLEASCITRMDDRRELVNSIGLLIAYLARPVGEAR